LDSSGSAFSADGRLASSFSDNTVRLWNVATGDLERTFPGHKATVSVVGFLENGHLFSSSNDMTVRIWDTDKGNLLQKRNLREGHFDPVKMTVAFSQNSQRLACWSFDRHVCLWDTTTWALERILEGHCDQVTSAAFSQEGRLLATGSHDKTVRLWDIATGASLPWNLGGHSDWVNSVAFSPDGRLLASGSSEWHHYYLECSHRCSNWLPRGQPWGSGLVSSLFSRWLVNSIWLYQFNNRSLEYGHRYCSS
jgi:FOG: WD40 repeat